MGPLYRESVSLRKYLETRLESQEKAVVSAFAASEKAITKAEEAQREYNLRSNEFRGQLDDQAKMLMQRTEALGLFRASEEKLETQRLVFEAKIDAMQREVAALREFRSQSSGAKTSIRDAWGYLIAVAGLAIGLTRFLR